MDNYTGIIVDDEGAMLAYVDGVLQWVMNKDGFFQPSGEVDPYTGRPKLIEILFDG